MKDKTELEILKINEKIKEKDADWLGRWLQKFSIEGDFWLKEKREKIKKSDWLQGTIGIGFTGDMIDDIIEWVGNVFSDLSPLLLLIVGVGLGLIVIGAIISALRR